MELAPSTRQSPILARPDGVIVWTGDDSAGDNGLREALERWIDHALVVC